jgi:hypothetical protein
MRVRSIGIRVLLAMFALPPLAAPAGDRSISLADGSRIEGEIVFVTETTVRLRNGDGEFDVPLTLLAEAPPVRPPPAPPFDPAEIPDRIHLTDGGILVGRIFEESGPTVGVRTPAGRRMVPLFVARDRIVRIEYGRPARLSREGDRLARAAAAELDTRDPLLRDSAVAALRVLGEAAKPVLEEVLWAPETTPVARGVLLDLLHLPPLLRLLLDPPEATEAGLASELQLSPGQRTRLRDLLTEGRRRLDEQDPDTRDPAPLLDEIRREARSILTDVQLRRFQEIYGGGS